MPDSARIWMYAANRELKQDEVAWIRQNIQQFILGWNNHGKELTADGEVFENRFIVLSVNEAMVNASGCSIDSSVRFVKEIGKELNVDFFDRLNLWVKNNNSIERIHVSDLAKYPDGQLFDPMIGSLGDFHSSWLVPVQESILYKQFA